VTEYKDSRRLYLILKRSLFDELIGKISDFPGSEIGCFEPGNVFSRLTLSVELLIKAQRSCSRCPVAQKRQLLKQSVSGVYWYRKKGVIMSDASVAASADVYINWIDWGLKLDRMTHASVGTDLWTVVQNRLHPPVAETEFTPLDLSYLRR
jgi:hypothetical protein